MRTRHLFVADLTVLSIGLVAVLALNGSATTPAPTVSDAAVVATSPLPLAAPPPVAPEPAAPEPVRTPKPSPTPPATRAPAPEPAVTRAPQAQLRAHHSSKTRTDLSVYTGLGTWVDAYDFAPEFGGRLSPATIDKMAAAGIETLYLQAAKEDDRSPGLLVRPDLVRQWVARAHARGINVVAWYLPKLLDPARDRAHLKALLDFQVNGRGFDSIGLDIEARNVDNLRVRNTRLVSLARWLRAAAPNMPLAGIVLAPVHTDIVSPDYWPRFPWAQLRPIFDVWQTMGYWTNRKSSSPYSNAYNATFKNVQLLRGHLGDVPVHPIGGIGVENVDQLWGYIKALHDSGSLGGSLYDWNTTPYNAYGYLARVPQ